MEAGGIVVRIARLVDLRGLWLEARLVPLGVDVCCRPAGLLAEQLLRSSGVARREVELRAGRVAGRVHLHPLRLPGLDDAGPLQAAVPPPVERGRAQRLEPVRVHDRDLRLVLARDLALLPARGLDLREEQVLVPVAPEDEQLELLAQLFRR